ncbi:MAG: L,D-transpeptidase family protein [Dehalococcoidia bacterium]
MTRHTASVIVSATCLLVLTCLSSISADAAPAAPPLAPTKLAMTLAGNPEIVPPGSWIASTKLVIHLQAQVSAGPLIPQVEVERVAVAFSGQSNFSGPPISVSGPAVVRVTGLRNGQNYHWQVRLVDNTGLASSWVPFSDPTTSATDVSVDLVPPTRPVIRSASNPDQNRWYHNAAISLRWTSRDGLSGIKGYSWVLERRPHVIPPGSISSGAGLKLTNLGDGTWFVAVRSVDRAGNWSPTATYRLQLDRQTPRVRWLSPNRFTFNPYKGGTSVHFSVSKDSAVQLDLYRVGQRKPTRTYAFPRVRAGQEETINWNGKNADGKPVTGGYYFFSARAIDHADNIAAVNLGGILVAPQQPRKAPTGQALFPGDGKRIIVSLSRQTLYAYAGDHLVLQTFVTTGNPNLPTPVGNYTVMAKYHPFQFISPWPLGSPYWYAPSWSDHAMLFRAGGYFIHDAPWRGAFGPGTNGAGQPGTNYGGTHGCVNVPSDPMIFLWDWSPVGTTVEVVP